MTVKFDFATRDVKVRPMPVPEGTKDSSKAPFSTAVPSKIRYEEIVLMPVGLTNVAVLTGRLASVTDSLIW